MSHGEVRSRARAAPLAVLGVALSVIVAACTRTRTPPAVPTSVQATPTPARPPVSRAKIHRGVVVWASGVASITPCHEDASLTLDDRTGGTLASVRAEVAPAEGDGLFVELRGDRAGSVLAATQVLRATPLGEGEPCRHVAQPGELRAYGNEPFWAVSVTQERIEWQEPDLESPLVFPAPTRRNDGPDARRWTAEEEGRHPGRIEVNVTRAPCRDGMSGAWHALSATVEIESSDALDDRRSFNGCAFEGE